MSPEQVWPSSLAPWGKRVCAVKMLRDVTQNPGHPQPRFLAPPTVWPRSGRVAGSMALGLFCGCPCSDNSQRMVTLLVTSAQCIFFFILYLGCQHRPQFASCPRGWSGRGKGGREWDNTRDRGRSRCQSKGLPQQSTNRNTYIESDCDVIKTEAKGKSNSETISPFHQATQCTFREDEHGDQVRSKPPRKNFLIENPLNMCFLWETNSNLVDYWQFHFLNSVIYWPGCSLEATWNCRRIRTKVTTTLRFNFSEL